VVEMFGKIISRSFKIVVEVGNGPVDCLHPLLGVVRLNSCQSVGLLIRLELELVLPTELRTHVPRQRNPSFEILFALVIFQTRLRRKYEQPLLLGEPICFFQVAPLDLFNLA
jgi:hypothetical protein